MKITVTESMFKQQFEVYGRQDQFSNQGLCALFDYLDDSVNEDYEFDVIGLCCDFSEESYVDAAQSYSIDLEDCEDDEERFDAVVEYMEDNTTVVFSDFDSGVILYQNF